jgi:hypothetical protein
MCELSIYAVRHRSPVHRWTVLLRSVAPLLLELLLAAPDRRGSLKRRLAAVLRSEAPDPNRRRMLLLERAEAGLQLAA